MQYLEVGSFNLQELQKKNIHQILQFIDISFNMKSVKLALEDSTWILKVGAKQVQAYVSLCPLKTTRAYIAKC